MWQILPWSQKIILSKVYTTDLINDEDHEENGINYGAGIGIGYKLIAIKHLSIEPVLGIGKGWSSHKDVFDIGGLGIGLFTPSWLIYRIECWVAYDF